MRYFLRHITRMSLPVATLLLVGALGMWVVDYIRVPEHWLSSLLTQCLVVTNALLLSTVLYRAKVGGHLSLLPAVLYTLAVGVLPYLRMHWHPQLIVLLLLLYLYATRDVSDTRDGNTLVMLVSVVLCALALLTPDALWCIVLLWVVALMQGAFSVRTILATVLGVALVVLYYLIAMYMGWAEEFDLSVLIDRHWIGRDVPAGVVVAVLVMLVGQLLAMIGAFSRSSYDLVSARLLLYHLTIWSWLTAPLILFTVAQPDIWVLLPLTFAGLMGICLLQKQSEARGIALIVYLIGAVGTYVWLTVTL